MVQKISDALGVSWYSLLGENDALEGLVKAVDAIDYDPQKQRPMVDTDNRIYAQDLKTLDELKDIEFKKGHPECSDCSHGQIDGLTARMRYMDNLFCCLNENGQKLLSEIAKGICMLDEYRVDLPLETFLGYEKTLQKELSIKDSSNHTD